MLDSLQVEIRWSHFAIPLRYSEVTVVLLFVAIHINFTCEDQFFIMLLQNLSKEQLFVHLKLSAFDIKHQESWRE